MGGAIADGTYFLTAYVAHTNVLLPTDPFIRGQVVITGNTWQDVEGSPEPSDVNPPRHATSTITTNASQFSLQRTCPDNGQIETSGYTARSDGFTIFIVDAGISVETVFTKQ